MTNEPEPNTRAGEALMDSAVELMGEALFKFSGRMKMAGVFAAGSELTDANAASYERVVGAWQKLTGEIERSKLPTWDHYAEEHVDTRPLPQPSDTWRDSQFLVATVSQDGREVGIDHPTDANWDDVLRAHISLRDRINERLAENGNCPFKPQPSELVDDDARLILRLAGVVNRLTPGAIERADLDGMAFTVREAEDRIAELSAQIAKLQARLEVVPGWSEDADGIACRNDTIKLQDECIAKLQADGDKLAGALERSRQGWSNVLELGLLPVQHQSTALGLHEAATQALTEWKDRA